MPDKIWVPMPESKMYGQRGAGRRDQLVGQYGEATVTRAETAVILNLLYLIGVIKPSEFFDAMVQQCRRIEDERQGAAHLEADRG